MELLTPEIDNPSTARIQAELAELQRQQSSLTYRISQRENRTLIYLEILPDSKIAVDIEGESPTYYSFDEMKEYSFQQEPRGKAILIEKGLSKQSTHTRTRVPSQSRNEVTIHTQHEETVIFLIILYHDVYPFEAPFVTISRANIFPRPDNFTNYYYSIMMTKIWWPLITLKDIICQLPHFAYKLRKMSDEGTPLPFNRHYCINQVCHKADMDQEAKGMLLVTAKLYHKKTNKGLRLVGLTHSHLLIFRTHPNNGTLLIQQIIKIRQLQKMIEKQPAGKSKAELIFNFTNELQTNIIFPLSELTTPALASLRLYSRYYQLRQLQQSMPHGAQTVRMINAFEAYVQFAGKIGNEEATTWGKRSLQRLINKYSDY